MSVELIQLLVPQRVPTDLSVLAWPGRARVAAAVAEVGAGRPGATHPAWADAWLAVTADAALASELTPVTGGPADDAAHDAYFRVARVDGQACATFVRSAIVARGILWQEAAEAPVGCGTPTLDAIDRALADLVGCALGGPVGGLPAAADWDCRGDRRAVMPRWLRGHQVFAVLSQGLIFSFASLARAVRDGRVAEMHRWADLTVSLLRGSAASFVLTGDFAVEDYVRDVRPSMMPPAAPICLSGLMSADHRVLVQCIRDLKPALRSLHQRAPDHHARILDALRSVYDHHIHVCERFVGDRPSLLTAGSTDKSGPALIAQFKAMRLKPFDAPARTAPITAHPGQAVPAREPPVRAEPAMPSCPHHARPPRSDVPSD